MKFEDELKIAIVSKEPTKTKIADFESMQVLKEGSYLRLCETRVFIRLNLKVKEFDKLN